MDGGAFSNLIAVLKNEYAPIDVRAAAAVGLKSLAGLSRKDSHL